MKLTFNVDKPEMFAKEDLNSFLLLLEEQGEVDDPSMIKIKRCILICMVHADNQAIGIGAIKHNAKSAFTKAGIQSLAANFDAELGYLYVKAVNGYRGLGIGKAISRLLLKERWNFNVFATTAVGTNASKMLFILTHLGFMKEGNTYFGAKTKKPLGLFLKYKNV